MRILSSIILFSLISLLFLQCTEEPSLRANVYFDDVYFTDLADLDGDGYYSYGKLVFDIDTDGSSLSVIVKVGVRTHSTSSGDLYDTYFESAQFTINGQSASDAKYLDIGIPNSELAEGYYDFLIQVHEAANESNIVAEANPTSFGAINNVPFESTSTEIVEEWVTNIDGGSFEGSYKLPARLPLGVTYSNVTEKFVLPSSSSIQMKKFRVHIPQSDAIPTDLIVTIRNHNASADEPNEVLTSKTFQISSTGWNTFDWEYSLTGNETFYLSVPPSQTYAISTDNNSTDLFGYIYKYTSSNPPTYGWEKLDLNYGIEVYVQYIPN